MYLLAILGLLTVIAFGVMMDGNPNAVNFLLPCTVISFFIGLYGIAFSVRKEK
ncbi:MAG: hypothetical protein ACTSRX_07595 [Promethearchaeota archaeon]